jgi:predicted PurR-regulated permease PerM
MTARTAAGAALLAIALAIVLFAFDLALLLFAAVLLAVVLDGAASRLSARTRTRRGIALALVIGGATGAAALLGLIAVPAVGRELAELRSRLPEAVQMLQTLVNRFGWVETAFDAMPSGELTLGRPGIAGRLNNALTSTVGAIANLLVVVLLALYLAASPRTYVEGAVRLFPVEHRARAAHVLRAEAEILFAWLQGQLISMAIVGTLVTLGLWIIGVPLAPTLGFIAGLFEFIPNIGPIAAGVPAALMGLTVGPAHVLYVVALYVVVQTLESYLITPMVMKRALSLPPALTILAQLVGALTAGWLGLLLATPLVAALLVLTQKVYLEDVLGEKDAAAG